MKKIVALTLLAFVAVNSAQAFDLGKITNSINKTTEKANTGLQKAGSTVNTAAGQANSVAGQATAVAADPTAAAKSQVTNQVTNQVNTQLQNVQPVQLNNPTTGAPIAVDPKSVLPVK